MNKHEYKYQHAIENIHADINEIKGDVKSLLRFKWKVIGGAGAIGAVTSIILSLLGLKVF